MQSKPQLNWVKHPRGGWYRLADLDLTATGLEGYGVYVVWHGGFPSRVVCVGHGPLANELRAQQSHPEGTLYAETGPLYVTWAVLDRASAAGVSRYLADKLRPLIEDDASGVVPIAANSPF